MPRISRGLVITLWTLSAVWVGADAIVGSANQSLMILMRGLTLLWVALASCSLVMWHAERQSRAIPPNPTRHLLFGIEMGWKACAAVHAVRESAEDVGNVIQFRRPVAAAPPAARTSWAPGYAAYVGPGPGRPA